METEYFPHNRKSGIDNAGLSQIYDASSREKGCIGKGLANNNLLEFAPRFRSDSFDPKAQSHRNS